MIYLFLFPQYLSRRVIPFILALFASIATPAAGQFLSDGVTPVTPLPVSHTTLLTNISNCLAEQPVTGCRATRGVGDGRDCGTGAALGYSAASGNGLTLFNATVEFDNVADTKNGSLALNIEHNF